ncbi:hypothetical protein ACQKKK_12010 [Peribacillus sp. NPDC006672]|uniref:hypothetical protein n=1 Tax=Peribacillus sp. NPDC006672 TaxID=3390606 RepID=UPI003D0304BE
MFSITFCSLRWPSNEMGKLLASFKPTHFGIACNDGGNIHDCILANAKEVAILPA